VTDYLKRRQQRADPPPNKPFSEKCGAVKHYSSAPFGKLFIGASTMDRRNVESVREDVPSQGIKPASVNTQASYVFKSALYSKLEKVEKSEYRCKTLILARNDTHVPQRKRC